MKSGMRELLCGILALANLIFWKFTWRKFGPCEIVCLSHWGHMLSRILEIQFIIRRWGKVINYWKIFYSKWKEISASTYPYFCVRSLKKLTLLCEFTVHLLTNWKRKHKLHFSRDHLFIKTEENYKNGYQGLGLGVFKFGIKTQQMFVEEIKKTY